MSLDIRKIVDRSFKDIKRFRRMIFVLVILTGIPLWFFRFMILWGIIENPHGRNFWFMDFECYYRAAQNYMIGGEIYGHCFYYPPVSLWFFLPFALFEFELASFVFTLVNLFSTILIYYLITKIINLNKIELKNIEKVYIILFVFVFYPSAITLTHGQINIVMLLFLGIFYYYTLYKNNSTIGAISLNLAAIFKIWPISLAILGIFLEKSKKLLVICILIFCLILFVSIFAFSYKTVEAFITSLLKFQSIKIYSFEEIEENYLNVVDLNASIFNTIGKLGAIFDLSAGYVILLNIFLKAAIIAYVLALLFLKAKKIYDENIRTILTSNILISTIFIVSNVTWIYYFTFLLFSIFFYFYLLETNIKERILLFLVILLLSLQQYVVFGAKLLGGFLALIFYLFPPAMIAFILYFILSVYSFVAAHREKLL